MKNKASEFVTFELHRLLAEAFPDAGITVGSGWTMSGDPVITYTITTPQWSSTGVEALTQAETRSLRTAQRLAAKIETSISGGNDEQ